MATLKKFFAAVGTVLAVYLLVSVFYFLFSIGNPYSDGDMFLRGIIGLPLWMQLLGGVLITFAVFYITTRKKEVVNIMEKTFRKIFAGK